MNGPGWVYRVRYSESIPGLPHERATVCRYFFEVDEARDFYDAKRSSGGHAGFESAVVQDFYAVSPSEAL